MIRPHLLQSNRRNILDTQPVVLQCEPANERTNEVNEVNETKRRTTRLRIEQQTSE